MDQKELREQENRCIQEHAPACTATCPAHVNVRLLIQEIATGNFAAALQTYRKAVPFPAIISRICDQPCQAACLRKELGGAIEVAALERACVEQSGYAKAIKQLPRKSKTVAVIGAGISGLTVAHDLARKGWGVVVFEASDRIGGGLWQAPADLLPRDVLQADLSIIEELGVEIRLNEPVGRSAGNGHRTFLTRLCEEYDAVYLGMGSHSSDITDLRLDRQGRIEIDPLTFQTSQDKVFAGGDVLRFSVEFSKPPVLQHSAILSLSEGRRAATSIDRYLQKVSLTAVRNNEGPYITQLYTDTAGVPSQVSPVKTDLSTHYSREAAETEAARCIQCECMECTKTCEFLKHYKGYPKKYIREIYNNLSIVTGTRSANQFINSCALCGLCGEVCPNDVDVGAICKDARVQMVDTKRMPPSAHDFALRDMAFSNGEKFRLARNAPGLDSSTYAFFPGCQLSASSPDYVDKMYTFLTGAYPSEGVGLMLRCCGAPADWAGRKDLFVQSQNEFRAEYEKLGKPKIIVACSSCHQMFQLHYPDVQIASFWDIFDQLGPQNFSGREFMGPVAVHDPCSTRYESHIQDSVRNILQKLGCEIQELPLSREKTECCSYGGLMWLANRPVAEKTVQRRINESPLDYVTYCAMCRDFFARRGKRTLHLLDLIYGPPEADAALAPAVGFSQRHENRARLKEKLLKERWSEAMPEGHSFESIRLILPEAVQKIVEERLILIEDMQKVIEHAERSGKRMFNSSSGHYLAYFKPTSVTYWVEYTPQSDGAFLVHKAYSHRMEIGTGAQK